MSDVECRSANINIVEKIVKRTMPLRKQKKTGDKKEIDHAAVNNKQTTNHVADASNRPTSKKTNANICHEQITFDS